MTDVNNILTESSKLFRFDIDRLSFICLNHGHLFV